MNQENLKQDFYKEVNREWLKTAKIPGDRPSTGSFLEIDNRLRKDVTKFANKLASKISAVNDPILQEFAKFYRITKNIKKREELGVEPIQKYIQEINAISSYQEIEDRFAELTHKGYFMPFVYGIDQDFVDNTLQVLSISSPKLLLPEKSYYLDTEKRDKLLEVLRKVSLTLLTTVNFEYDQAKEIIEDAFSFDASLVEMYKTAEERANYVASYNVYKFSELNQKSHIFDLHKIAKSLTGDDQIETAIFDNPRFVEAINQIYTADNFKLFKARMILSNVFSKVDYLTEDLRKIKNQYAAAITGVNKLESVKKFAFRIASSHFNMPLGVAYAMENFGQEAKNNVEKMVTTMIGIYKQRLQKNTWLSPQTIAKAITKLEALRMMIGYPDEFETFYNELKTTNMGNGANIIDNIVNFDIVYSKYHFNQYMKPVNQNYWEMSPAMVNAYFHPFKNVIVFPAGILSDPFYDFNNHSSANYGGIGAVIAHEISHAFDNNGSQFDEKGNLNNWWTDHDRAEFTKRAQGVIDLFEGQKTKYGKCNGKLTVSENIADLGGFACAFEAASLEPDFDPKLFFYNWAKVWRSKYRMQYGQLLLKSDVHAPTSLRANIQVKNHPAFYELFDVKPNDKMYLEPEKRTSIW